MTMMVGELKIVVVGCLNPGAEKQIARDFYSNSLTRNVALSIGLALMGSQSEVLLETAADMSTWVGVV